MSKEHSIKNYSNPLSVETKQWTTNILVADLLQDPIRSLQTSDATLYLDCPILLHENKNRLIQFFNS